MQGIQHKTQFKLTDEEAADVFLDIIEETPKKELDKLIEKDENTNVYASYMIGFYVGLQLAGTSCGMNCENCQVKDQCLIRNAFHNYGQVKAKLEQEGREEAKKFVLDFMSRIESKLENENFERDKHYI